MRSARRTTHRRRRRVSGTLVVVLILLSVLACVWYMHGRRGKPLPAPSEPLSVRFKGVNLPSWANVDPASWDTRLEYDEDLDLQPLLEGFNMSSVTPLKTTVRPDSGAFGQREEDLFAYTNFFWKMRGGVYLEAGALDGYSYSNTLLFDHFAGWRGILIEPGPQNYQLLLHNRPNAVCLNLAICEERQRVHIVEQWSEGGIYETMSRQHWQRWHKKRDPASLPSVVCESLGFVLQRLGVSHINLISLDVEGAELGVLRSVDLDKVTIDVIAVEARGYEEEKDHAVRIHLESKGFKLYGRQGYNYWFVHPGFNASAQLGPNSWRGVEPLPRMADERQLRQSLRKRREAAAAAAVAATSGSATSESKP